MYGFSKKKGVMDRKLDLQWYSILLSVEKKRENNNVRMWMIWWFETLTRTSIVSNVGGACRVLSPVKWKIELQGQYSHLFSFLVTFLNCCKPFLL
jgi:hypothetical protein